MNWEDEDLVFVTQTPSENKQDYNYEGFGDDIEIGNQTGNNVGNTMYSDISDAEEGNNGNFEPTKPSFKEVNKIVY